MFACKFDPRLQTRGNRDRFSRFLERFPLDFYSENHVRVNGEKSIDDEINLRTLRITCLHGITEGQLVIVHFFFRFTITESFHPRFSWTDKTCLESRIFHRSVTASDRVEILAALRESISSSKLN